MSGKIPWPTGFGWARWAAVTLAVAGTLAPPSESRARGRPAWEPPYPGAWPRGFQPYLPITGPAPLRWLRPPPPPELSAPSPENPTQAVVSSLLSETDPTTAPVAAPPAEAPREAAPPGTTGPGLQPPLETPPEPPALEDFLPFFTPSAEESAAPAPSEIRFIPANPQPPSSATYQQIP